MISSLRGHVLSVKTNLAVIEVGGLGFLFFATPRTLSTLHVGSEAEVLTTLVVKEDSLTLYGFADADERSAFDILISVSGIGAKLALAVLAVLEPDQLRIAVSTKNEKMLTQVPGIGAKGAKRMILEIGDKLGPALGTAPVGTETDVKAAQEGDVLEALVNLGWHEREAQSAVEQALAEQPSATVAQLLRSALQILGSRR